ncbi:hypothetical protein BC831DRAFT_478788 [Entophlyctis helioformis]|nr:hypothetical protein BC831DRAFT_478788 [Entophlyctis helioformis]
MHAERTVHPHGDPRHRHDALFATKLDTMPRDWTQIAADFERLLEPSGLDLVQPLDISWYNRAVPPAFRVHVPGVDTDSCLAILVGNSRAFWTPFTASLATHGSAWLATHANPVDDYVAEAVGRAVSEVGDETVGETVHVWHSFQTSEGRLVAFQRCAHESRLAVYNEGCGLVLHPTHGPWIALRSLVVLPGVRGPPAQPAPVADPLPASLTAELSAQTAALMAAAAESGYDWRPWREMRLRVSALMGPDVHGSAYPPDMLDYHYTHSLALLRPYTEPE